MCLLSLSLSLFFSLWSLAYYVFSFSLFFSPWSLAHCLFILSILCGLPASVSLPSFFLYLSMHLCMWSHFLSLTFLYSLCMVCLSFCFSLVSVSLTFTLSLSFYTFLSITPCLSSCGLSVTLPPCFCLSMLSLFLASVSLFLPTFCFLCFCVSPYVILSVFHFSVATSLLPPRPHTQNAFVVAGSSL